MATKLSGTLKQTGKLAPATKPWQLIRDAIHDLTLQEKCKLVKIEMSEYHTPNGVCKQCLAGATMSRRLGTSLNENVLPWAFEKSIEQRLRALNLFRMGLVADAYALHLKVEFPETHPSELCIAPYYKGPTAFKVAMLALADTLEKAHNGKPAKRL